MMEVLNLEHVHLKMWNRDTEIETLDRRLSYSEEAASLSLERTVSRVMWKPARETRGGHTSLLQWLQPQVINITKENLSEKQKQRIVFQLNWLLSC
jgi:hypothetical protein